LLFAAQQSTIRIRAAIPHAVVASLPLNLPMEAFGVLLNPGPFPEMVVDRLEQRRKEWFRPFLMAT
jgi:hypothetical protein